MTQARRCPICRREIPADANAPRPFCSARCRAVDLGSWLDGHYRIGSPVEEGEDENMPPPEPVRGKDES
jgi:endogenous inhibitor of DNA gyrase (YacG/DUF329 family)